MPPAFGAPLPSKRGSALVFHGWSPDSRLIAYTRQRLGRARRDQRMQRFVAHGRFTGFGAQVGGDVARRAQERGYVAIPAPRRRPSEDLIEFDQGQGTLELTLRVSRAQRWELRRQGVLLAEHTFDRIYVDFDAELFPAPDGSQAVLVMHLDTGWEVDAAIFPVSLSAIPE